MLHRNLVALMLAVVAFAPGCKSSAPQEPITVTRTVVRKAPTTAAVIPLSPPTAGEITVEQLALLLPRHPIVVGFDVDDTLIFSAPAFNALQPQYEPDVIRPKDYAALSPDQKAKYHEFWNKLNTEFDDRSLPKKIGKRLLDLHLSRGDEIWIISKRQSIVPEPSTEVITQRYERMFGVKLPHPVVQTQLKDKTPFIYERHIDYYYGDADTDVTASVAAQRGDVLVVEVRRADVFHVDVRTVRKGIVRDRDRDEVGLAARQELHAGARELGQPDHEVAFGVRIIGGPAGAAGFTAGAGVDAAAEDEAAAKRVCGGIAWIDAGTAAELRRGCADDAAQQRGADQAAAYHFGAFESVR
jgi:acid phosphatase (class B)